MTELASTPPEPDSTPSEPVSTPTEPTPPSTWRSSLIWFAVVVLIGAAFTAGLLIAGGEEDTGEHAHEEKASQTWTCSMHPQIKEPEFGLCPLCGMDLIPLAEGAGASDGSPTRITLTERSKALARIRTSAVLPRDNPNTSLRLLGRLDYNETLSRTVTPWTAGRVDRLHVATTGTKVKRGQVIASVYSPEIYTAHQDLLSAKGQLARLDGATPMAREAAKATLNASRNRLALLGVTPRELSRMEQATKPLTRVPIRSPFAGTVVERMVSEGQYVSAGTPLYKLVELSELWVQLDAYEQDLVHLSEGSPVRITFEALPGRIFEGSVAFIDPVVDRQTRTTRVRVEVENGDGALKPGMFAEAVVAVQRDEDQLVVPETAPLFSGKRSLVYVEVPGAETPTYEAREVRLGQHTGDYYPVIAGLAYGDRVVTHGAFRLDADLQLQGGLSLMSRGDDRSPGKFDDVIVLPIASRRSLEPVVVAYLDAQEALADDDLERARGIVEGMLAILDITLAPAEADKAWRVIRDELRVHGRYMIGASDVDKARVAFEALTSQMKHLLATFGNPTNGPLRLAYCPMAFDNRGASWFQRGETIDNAYFGAEMLQCGEVKGTLEGGGFLPNEPSSMPDSAPDSAPDAQPTSEPAPAPKSVKARSRAKKTPAAAGQRKKTGSDKAPSSPTSNPASSPASAPGSAPGSQPTSKPGSKPASSAASKPVRGKP